MAFPSGRTTSRSIRNSLVSSALEKIIGGILAISPGLFLGREGPSIQLGAVVGQGYSQWRQSTKSEEKF